MNVGVQVGPFMAGVDLAAFVALTGVLATIGVSLARRFLR